MAGTPIPQELPVSERNFRKLERRAALISDPAEKLRYLRRHMQPEKPRRRRARLSLAASMAVLAGISFFAYNRIGSAAAPKPVKAASEAVPRAAGAVASVWLVEEKNGTEHYSNGLRVERKLEVSTRPRRYRVFERASGTWSERTAPAGIVFHSTESLIEPFTPAHNDELKQAARGILAYVRERELYNFVIDRFGRVSRLVREEDAAHHAGHSVWANAEHLYIDLNDSFLGVSFEAQTAPSTPSWTAAQATSAKLLTEMLRSKYGIGPENCVTHAQVSVNPRNMQLGYHTDWATGFPFEELGLRNLYREPNPAIALFGFGYGPDLIAAAGGKPWDGLVSAELRLVEEAAAVGQTTSGYRRMLHQKYKKSVEAARDHAAPRERTHDES